MAEKITVETEVNVPVERAWEIWTDAGHIMEWNHASDDWQTPSVTNNVEEDGEFDIRMESVDGSEGFNFKGTYTKVEQPNILEYEIEDGRKVSVEFTGDGNKTKIVETFEAENENPIEMQKEGWQSILDNFKKYAESM